MEVIGYTHAPAVLIRGAAPGIHEMGGRLGSRDGL
jgi:hypothetical protein